MAPRFVTEARRGDEVVQEFPTVVLRERMCKPEVLRNIQICLEGVVGKNTGTGKLAYSKYFSVAGKTGTAQIWSKGGFASNYLVSFAGYFPADRPRYSMIVCIEKGAPAYGGIHCCPVFKKIAEGVMAKNHKTNYEAAIDTTALRTAPPMMQSGNLVALSEVLKELKLPHRNNYHTSEGLAWGQPLNQGSLLLNNESTQKGLPSVIGYGLRDAVYRLERMGVKVKVTGFGRVVAQSLPPGSPVKAGMVVQIQLSMEQKPNIDIEMSEEPVVSPETTTASSNPKTPSSGATNSSSSATTASSNTTTQSSRAATASSNAAAAKSEKKSEKKVEKKDNSSGNKEEKTKKQNASTKEKDKSSEKKSENKSKSSAKSEATKQKEKAKKGESSPKKNEPSKKADFSARKKDDSSKKKGDSSSKKPDSSAKRKEDSGKKKDESSKKKDASKKSK